jgi:hypothetical protein
MKLSMVLALGVTGALTVGCAGGTSGGGGGADQRRARMACEDLARARGVSLREVESVQNIGGTRYEVVLVARRGDPQRCVYDAKDGKADMR